MKYHVFFLYDVKAYLETLDKLSLLNCDMYVPSHCEASSDISNLIEINREKIHEILDTVYTICTNPKPFETILKEIFDKYGLQMNVNQYVLIGSTIKAYLSYLKDNGKITYIFEDNKMLWMKV